MLLGAVMSHRATAEPQEQTESLLLAYSHFHCEMTGLFPVSPLHLLLLDVVCSTCIFFMFL